MPVSSKQHIIQVGELEAEVDRKEIKHIHLSVYPPNGRVRIASPLQVDDETLRLFMLSKRKWILKEQEKFQNQARESKRDFIDGESHYFEGHRYLLKVIEKSAAPTIELKGKWLNLYVRPNSGRDKREQVLHDFYRKSLKARIVPLIATWENRMNVSVNAWGVKKMKTKWGSCTPEAGRIWLNLELAKHPLSHLEYVIVHEMTHLLVRHHNEQFVAYLDEFLPNWEAVRRDLNAALLGYVDWEV